jgi:(R,R)-butanediol dehydrogenase/meso-butanediol dehydrogenase/diacetyl reductase
MDIRLDEIDEPRVGPTDVKLKVAYNGICGTDLHFFFALGRPLRLGHEYAGTVTEVGAQVRDIAPGDNVCVYPADSCLQCGPCRDGYDVQCELFDRSISTVGCGSPIGGLAEYSVVPQHLAVKLPSQLTLEYGALVEPLAVSMTTVQRAQVSPNDVAVVFGAGPIGIGVAMALQTVPCERIIVFEPSEERRKALSGLVPAAEIVDPREVNPAGDIKDRTSGLGADVVFECAGAEASFISTTSVARRRGLVVLIGIYESPVTYVPNEICVKELRIVGHNGSTREAFAAVIDHMVAGHYVADGWTEHVPWEKLVPDGFERLRRGEAVKVLVDIPGGGGSV